MSYFDQRDLSFFCRERADDRLGFWWLCENTTEWQAAKDDLRVSFPHHANLRYDASAREWTLPRYMINRLQQWANAWSSKQNWDAVPRNGERRQYRSEGAEDAPCASLTSAYAMLHLLPSAPPELVTAAYRTLAQLHHPDRGGDATAMVQLNQAVAFLRDGEARRSA